MGGEYMTLLPAVLSEYNVLVWAYVFAKVCLVWQIKIV